MTDHLLRIKRAAEELQEAPWKHVEIAVRRIPGDPPWDLIEEQWYSDYIEDAGGTDQYVLISPHPAVSKWLAGVEKVRHQSLALNSVIIIYDWIIRPRNSKGIRSGSNAFAYNFNGVVFETPVRSKVKRPLWETGQNRRVRDKVRILFRVPEFTQAPAELVTEHFLTS